MKRTPRLLATLIGTLVLGAASASATATVATAATTTATASTCASSRPLLSQGDEGGCVPYLQRALTNNGFPTTVDGIFGPRTEAAVEDFQYACGFRGSDVDGIVGPHTWAGLLDHACA
ncbi:peptidoglycan-binding domain-containing protein [Kitasatospora sp. NPDC094028]